jgi:hexosaminidase
MSFPRAAAIAEIGWSQPQNKNWESFKQRLEKQYKRYANAGINYSKSAYDVWIESTIDSSANKTTVKLKTNSVDHDIRYTTDGTEPTIKSAKYVNPFTFSLPSTVKAASFRNGEKISRVSARSVFISKVD